MIETKKAPELLIPTKSPIKTYLVNREIMSLDDFLDAIDQVQKEERKEDEGFNFLKPALLLANDSGIMCWYEEDRIPPSSEYRIMLIGNVCSVSHISKKVVTIAAIRNARDRFRSDPKTKNKKGEIHLKQEQREILPPMVKIGMKEDL